MAKTPYYKVVIKKSGRDISGLISKFSHEDAVDQDNILTISISNSTTDIIDDPDLKEGELLTFQYGYAQGKSSPKYIARIIDIMPNYIDVINVTIRATDLGINMKKNSSKKVWQNKKASTIVKQIALANGLTAIVDETTFVYKSLAQGGKSDYDFIKYLVAREKDGSFRFFLKNDELHFTKIKLDQPSKRTLRWNDGDGILQKFRPYSQESLKKASARDTVVTTVDPFTNKPVQTIVNNTTSKDDVKMGEYVYNYNAQEQSFSLLTNQRPSQVQSAQQDTSKASKHVFTPTGTSDFAQNIGNSIKKKSALKDYMSQATLEGDPDFVADQVITMAGVAKKDTGNWYVMRANHIIDSTSSFVTVLTSSKNAGKKKIGDGTKQSNVNKTTGPDQKDNLPEKKEVIVYVYDKDANQLSP